MALRNYVVFTFSMISLLAAYSSKAGISLGSTSALQFEIRDSHKQIRERYMMESMRALKEGKTLEDYLESKAPTRRMKVSVKLTTSPSKKYKATKIHRTLRKIKTNKNKLKTECSAIRSKKKRARCLKALKKAKARR